MNATLDFNSAVTTWTRGRLSFDPGYYAGRGPKSVDLNDVMLEGIFLGIKADFGITEAANFVRFVHIQKDMSATAFLVAFQKFFNRKCLDVNIEQLPEDGMQVTARGEALFSQLFASIVTASSNRTTPAEIEQLSNEIKSPFMAKYRSLIPSEKS